MVYFIECTCGCQAIKIGHSSVTSRHDFDRRMIGLQIGSPHKLRLLLTIEGGAETERNLHYMFASRRIRGEWFAGEGKLREFIVDRLAFHMMASKYGDDAAELAQFSP